jgi:DNA-binding MarR family transcriptional regulator
MNRRPLRESASSPPSGAERGSAHGAWAQIFELALHLRGHWTAMAAEADLTPSQAMALKHLDPAAPVPMTTLAASLSCDASNVTGIVDKLESRGLIARQTSEQDRRVKMLVVTPEGARLRARFLERLLDPPRAVLELSPDERARLCDTLGRLLARWPQQD